MHPLKNQRKIAFKYKDFAGEWQRFYVLLSKKKYQKALFLFDGLRIYCEIKIMRWAFAMFSWQSKYKRLNRWTVPLFLSINLFSTAVEAGLFQDQIVQRIEQSLKYRQLNIQHQALIVDHIRRFYQIYNPAPDHKNLPVVIALHGGGGNATQMIKRFQDQAQQHKFLLVAPQGVGPSDQKGVWNSEGCCGEAMQQQINDIEFIKQLIAELQQHYSIDKTRIYVTGFSNGGMLTYQLANRLSQQLAAVAVVSGAMFEGQPKSLKVIPIPMMIIHGERDPVVSVQGGISSIRFVARAQHVPFQPLSYTLNYWKNTNQCKSMLEQQINAYLSIESGQHCKAPLLVYHLLEGKHVWPTSSNRYERIDASEQIWNFFKGFSRPDSYSTH